MSFLNKKTLWSNAEFIPLKLGIGSAYLLPGAYFHEFVRKHYLAFLILFAVTVSWSLYLWITKMKKNTG